MTAASRRAAIDRADVGSVIVVGGGISGLAAAWQLHNDGVPVQLLEQEPDVGGKIGATEIGGRLVDEAADAFLARVPHGIRLAEELGLSHLLISPAARHAEIWTGDSLMALPQPNVLGIPLAPDAVEALLGAEARDRVELDLARTAPDPVRDDDTIGSLVRRRLGDRIHTALVDPLLGAINAGDTDELSVHASSPQILAAAQSDPSLVRALQNMAAQRRSDAPVFHSFEGGVGIMIDELKLRLADHITTAVTVTGVTHDGDRLRLDTAHGTTYHADAVVLACPADVAARLVWAWPDAAERLASVPMVSVALITLVFDGDAFSPDASLSGFLVPRGGELTITACSYSSSKWPHLRGVDGNVVLRISVGHAGDQVTPELDDAELLDVVRSDLRTAAGIEAEPVATRISRWPDAFPQYVPGHLDRVAQAEGDLNPDGIFLTGMSYRGIGIPACIDQGRSAAVEAVLHLLD